MPRTKSYKLSKQSKEQILTRLFGEKNYSVNVFGDEMLGFFNGAAVKAEISSCCVYLCRLQKGCRGDMARRIMNDMICAVLDVPEFDFENQTKTDLDNDTFVTLTADTKEVMIFFHYKN